jgi:hypothetical protein
VWRCAAYVQAVEPSFGGSSSASLDAVVAKLTRAKAGKGYHSAREALLLNGRFVLAQVRSATASDPLSMAKACAAVGAAGKQCQLLRTEGITASDCMAQRHILMRHCDHCQMPNLVCIWWHTPRLYVGGLPADVAVPVAHGARAVPVLQLSAHEARTSGGALDKGKGKAGITAGLFFSELQAEVRIASQRRTAQRSACAPSYK